MNFNLINKYSMIKKKLIFFIISSSILTCLIIPKIIKQIKKQYYYYWFQRDSLKNDDSLPLNRLSGWEVSEKVFNETIEDWMYKMNPPIKPGNSIFELGCGVGAVLKYINDNIENLTISGSDFSPNAIKKIKQVFPKSKFYCQNMKKKNDIPSNYYDHVISAGALGMYLYKDEMLIAIKEAVRMTKPGGSLCFTHFIEKNGSFKGSIIQRVDKTYWLNKSDYLGIENIKFFTLKHQGDRYGFVCNKKK